MKAKFLCTEGHYLEAILEIEGREYVVMDEFTENVESMPTTGSTFDFEFFSLLDDNESWESIFQSNPQKKKCIEQISGWKYRAFGEIVSINPVKVDCGVLVADEVIHTNDPKVVGEYISFTISRLGCYSAQSCV